MNVDAGQRLPRIAGHPTHVVRAGGGLRRALFIHCTLGRAGTWAAVQARLLDKLAMTAFDRPGHGASAPFAGEGGAVALHRLTTQIAARLIEGRADVIGHSFGATVALRLAMERPELVRSLTLIEPPLFALAADRPATAGQRRMMEEVEAALAAGDRTAAARRFHQAVNPEVPWDRLAPTARTRLADQIHLVVEEGAVTTDDAAGLGASGRLESVRQPALLIEGSASPPAFGAVQDVLAGRLPGVRRVVVMGAGHMSPLSHPDNIAAEIAAFLKL